MKAPKLGLGLALGADTVIALNLDTHLSLQLMDLHRAAEAIEVGFEAVERAGDDLGEPQKLLA
jgi:hypothetical protein